MAYQIGLPIIEILESDEYGLVWTDSVKRTHYYTKDGVYDGYSIEMDPYEDDDFDEALMDALSLNNKNYLA